MGGFGDGLPFSPWIADHIRRKDTQERSRPARPGPRRRCGLPGRRVTTVADCCYAGTVAQAAGEAGLRAIVYLEGFSVWEGLEARIEAALDALPVSELVTAGVSPHAPFTVTPRRLRDARRPRPPARPAGGDAPARVDARDRAPGRVRGRARARHGRDPRRAGGRGRHRAAGRARHPGGALPALERAARAAASRRSPSCSRPGVRVGLGTDSPSSAIDFDMWAEMRTAIMLQRARTARADALSAQTALELATTRAAAAIGLGDRVGSLTPGKAADLIVLDLAGSPFLPWDDPVTAAVFGGAPERVALSVVAGEIRYRRGERTPPTASAARAKMIQAPTRLITRALRTHPPHPEARLHLPRRSCSAWGSSPSASARARAASTSATCSARAARAAAPRSRACSRSVQSHPEGCGRVAAAGARLRGRTTRRTRRSRRSRPIWRLKPKDQGALSSTSTLLEQRGQQTAGKVQQAQAAAAALHPGRGRRPRRAR